MNSNIIFPTLSWSKPRNDLLKSEKNIQTSSILESKKISRIYVANAYIYIYIHIYIYNKKTAVHKIYNMGHRTQNEFGELVTCWVAWCGKDTRILLSVNFGFISLERWILSKNLFYRNPLNTINPLTPNDDYSGRTAPLTSKRCILYIYSTNIGTEYFKHGIYSPFFSYSKCSLFHKSKVFGSCIIHVLYTECAKS